MSSSAPRRTQQRSLETRGALLDAATRAFSTHGFDGVSARQLEELAGVNRGLVAYHFGDKDGLWRAVVDRIFVAFGALFGDRLPAFADVAAREAAKAFLRTFVRFSAEHPELNRLMLQECMQASWRVDYIVTTHVRPMLSRMKDSLPEVFRMLFGAGDGDPHRYYAMVGAGAFVFSAEPECAGLFAVQPRTEAFVERHAEFMAKLLLEGEQL